MLEGTIKLHGQPEEAERFLRKVEQVLKHSDFSDLRIVCKTQQPAQPEAHAVTFIKPVGDAGHLRANWSRK